MKTDSYTLLEELRAITHKNLEASQKFKALQPHQLNAKPAHGGWSILQCLEHLNRYSAFYMPHLTEQIGSSSKNGSGKFRSGVIGNYLVTMVKPGEKAKKMKTFKSMDPAHLPIAENVLESFIATQEEMLELLKKAGSTDINNGKVPVTFSRLIQLKTGDTLRFMVYHNQRHILQALRLL